VAEGDTLNVVPTKGEGAAAAKARPVRFVCLRFVCLCICVFWVFWVLGVGGLCGGGGG
jgi:hypothetical protein